MMHNQRSCTSSHPSTHPVFHTPKTHTQPPHPHASGMDIHTSPPPKIHLRLQAAKVELQIACSPTPPAPHASPSFPIPAHTCAPALQAGRAGACGPPRRSARRAARPRWGAPPRATTEPRAPPGSAVACRCARPAGWRPAVVAIPVCPFVCLSCQACLGSYAHGAISGNREKHARALLRAHACVRARAAVPMSGASGNVSWSVAAARAAPPCERVGGVGVGWAFEAAELRCSHESHACVHCTAEAGGDMALTGWVHTHA
eukprot:43733-Chlamydomonas_euryale.AAC.10